MTNLKKHALAGSTLRTRGQAMTEYVLILSLVAVGCLMVTWSFGHQIAELFKRSTTALGTGQVEQAKAVHAEDYVGLSEGDRWSGK